MKKADNLIYLRLLKFDFAVHFEAVWGLIIDNCGVIGSETQTNSLWLHL